MCEVKLIVRLWEWIEAKRTRGSLPLWVDHGWFGYGANVKVYLEKTSKQQGEGSE